MRVLPRLEWRAFYGDQPTGEVKAWVRPDGRCSVFFDSCLPGAYRPLLNAVAASVSRDLYASIDEAAGEDLARYAELGFEVSRREGSYLIPVNPDTTGLRGTQAPAGFGVISAQNADEDRLRLLDDALRQDVPGTDGWQWDAAGFHTETFGADFDPAAYPAATCQASGDYAGLVRVWNNPDGPRLGLIAVLAPHRRRGLARALLAQAFRVLHERGKTEVIAEIDDTNSASISLLTGIGAHRTGGSIELVKRYQA
jgi:ribosomal protein S18 acetylase RimI-like enzyme